MKKIVKEDWDKVIDESNENFEGDFNELVARYYQITKEKIQKEKFLDRLKKSANLGLLKNIITRDNWIIDLDIYGETYMNKEELAVKRYEQVLVLLEDLRNGK